MALFTFHQGVGLVLIVLGSTTLPWTSGGVARGLQGVLDEAEEKHKEWVSSHGKVYKNSAEKEERQKVFKKNLEFIEKFNGQKRSFKLKPNKFADLSNQDFHQTLTGGFKVTNLTRSPTSATMKFPSAYQTLGAGDFASSFAPPSVDWRRRNALNPIREQGKCGSCWAFATVAAIESAIYIKTGRRPMLSVQQLLDCVKSHITRGCRGGNPNEAFTYITRNRGIASASSYHYKAKTGICRRTRRAATIAGYVDVPMNDEEALKYAVSKQPVVAFIDSNGDAFQFYAGGVYDAYCGTTLDHLVTIVGYGTTRNGVPYWLIKNSWGRDWGEDGYMRLLRNAGPPGGQCGIAMFASYPVV